jgi:general secretion pathway protein K
MNAPTVHVRQRGAAIVFAMGVAALAAIAATAILVSQSTWSRQSELSADHAQARALAQAGVDWARAVLSDDRRSNSTDHADEPWALRFAPVPVENGELAGYITDQQGLFNLNNVVRDGKTDATQLARYRRLLSILGLPAALAGTLADWIDADGEPQPQGGAEDATYLAQQPPYLPANRQLTDASELALVRGYDDSVRARLRPFVTALPRATAVNVNTAPPEVLAAVIEGMNLDQARALAAERDRAYFRDTADFVRRAPRDLTVSADGIAVSSAYFLVTMRATIGQAEARGQVLLARENADWPVIVWRKLP